jgi:hypothetical protein
MIPPILKIGPHLYNVYLVPSNQVDDCGSVNHQTHEIFIRNDMPLSLQLETLVHEILHVVRVDMATTLDDTDEEERLVQREGHLLFQILKENDIQFKQ